MRVLKVIKNQTGIFITAKYTKREALELFTFFTLEYKDKKYYFEVIEMETCDDNSLLCVLQEVGNPLQEMIEENNPKLLSELEGFDIRDILYTIMK